MKITIFISSLTGGGAERVASNLANYLSTRHEVTVLTVSNKRPGYFLDKNVKTTPLEQGSSSHSVLKNMKRIFNLRKYLKHSNQDLYVVFLRVPSFLLLFFKKTAGAPVIVSERADPSKYFNHSMIKRKIMKWLYPKADGFVFQTDDARKYYKGIIPSQGIVIPNAINKEFVRESYKGERKKRIVAAGRFTEQKNFDLLIRSFARVAKTFPDYQLIIYGDGPDKEKLVNLTKVLKIAERVEFPGYVSDIDNQLWDASLFVLSSNYEGMPNVLMESMALGVPCISTDCPVGGPNFLIDSKVNGVLVPVGDEMALSEAISDILSKPEYAALLGQEAQKISKRLSSEKIYHSWETYLQTVYKKR